MLARNFAVVLVCVMMAGTVIGDSDMGHIRPKSVNAVCSVNSVQVSWEEVQNTNLTGYNVYQQGPIRVNQDLVTGTVFIVTNLVSTTLYDFAVTAVYDDGISSELSDPASCTTG
jgi:hypothetical protein